MEGPPQSTKATAGLTSVRSSKGKERQVDEDEVDRLKRALETVQNYRTGIDAELRGRERAAVRQTGGRDGKVASSAAQRPDSSTTKKIDEEEKLQESIRKIVEALHEEASGPAQPRKQKRGDSSDMPDRIPLDGVAGGTGIAIDASTQKKLAKESPGPSSSHLINPFSNLVSAVKGTSKKFVGFVREDATALKEAGRRNVAFVKEDVLRAEEMAKEEADALKRGVDRGKRELKSLLKRRDSRDEGDRKGKEKNKVTVRDPEVEESDVEAWVRHIREMTKRLIEEGG